jgi:hypothetical protein
MVDFGRETASPTLRPMFVRETPATKVLKSALEQMFGCHSTNGGVG